MTRHRRLKRRIRVRMAKTGESYSTARREVLKRLGTAVPEQKDAQAATVPRRRRFYRAARRLLPGVALVALVGAVVAVVVIDSGDQEGQKQPSVEQQVSPADELPPGLRELLVRKGRDPLDRARSVECGVGRHAPVEFRSSLVPLIAMAVIRADEVPKTPRPSRLRVALDMARAVTSICRTELGSGVNISAKVGDTWVEIVPRAAVAGSSAEVRDESGDTVGISECPEATDAFQRAGVPVPTAYANKCPSRSEIEEMIPALRRVQRDAERLAALTTAPG